MLSNISDYTQNQARSIIRHTNNPVVVQKFLNHGNKNVVNSAKFALSFKFAGAPIPEKSQAAELAEQYSLDVSVVEKVLADKTMEGVVDMPAVKRSLAARKARASQKK